jgi:hypothetical protein
MIRMGWNRKKDSSGNSLIRLKKPNKRQDLASRDPYRPPPQKNFTWLVREYPIAFYIAEDRAGGGWRAKTGNS